MKKALESYEKAAEWFEGDNAEAYVPTLLLWDTERSVLIDLTE